MTPNRRSAANEFVLEHPAGGSINRREPRKRPSDRRNRLTLPQQLLRVHQVCAGCWWVWGWCSWGVWGWWWWGVWCGAVGGGGCWWCGAVGGVGLLVVWGWWWWGVWCGAGGGGECGVGPVVVGSVVWGRWWWGVWCGAGGGGECGVGLSLSRRHVLSERYATNKLGGSLPMHGGPVIGLGGRSTVGPIVGLGYRRASGAGRLVPVVTNRAAGSLKGYGAQSRLAR